MKEVNYTLCVKLQDDSIRFTFGSTKRSREIQ